jgi:hypothetical protein
MPFVSLLIEGESVLCSRMLQRDICMVKYYISYIINF